jgi:hypothetical protein
MGGSLAFHIDDYLGINGVWSYIKFGVACGDITQMNAAVRGVIGNLHCATTRNQAVKYDGNGKAFCDSGYLLSTAQVCMAGMGTNEYQLPSCPTNLPAFDIATGMCCAKGERFNTATMSCVASEALKQLVTQPTPTPQ